jgi:8-oxo-dGTP pyrophosphatase MutT (NUDIX family)
LLERNDHPRFGNDSDLPGGTVEAGETPLRAMVREVFEEAGITINPEKAKMLYSGTAYSSHQTEYTLYEIHFIDTPEVHLSWEHAAYKWLDRESFLEAIKTSPDTYMEMVYDTLSKQP